MALTCLVPPLLAYPPPHHHCRRASALNLKLVASDGTRRKSSANSKPQSFFQIAHEDFGVF